MSNASVSDIGASFVDLTQEEVPLLSNNVESANKRKADEALPSNGHVKLEDDTGHYDEAFCLPGSPMQPAFPSATPAIQVPTAGIAPMPSTTTTSYPSLSPRTLESIEEQIRRQHQLFETQVRMMQERERTQTQSPPSSPAAPATNTQPTSATAKMQASTQTAANQVPCPICLRPYPATSVEAHANICLDSGAANTAPLSPTRVTEPLCSPPSAPSGAASSSSSSSSSSFPSSSASAPPLTASTQVSENGGGSDYLTEQERFLQFWRTKQAQQEADRLLALKLMEQDKTTPAPTTSREEQDRLLALRLAEENEKSMTQKVREREEADRALALKLLEAEKPRPSVSVREDERLARELFEKEQADVERARRDKEQRDKELAEKLWRQEQEAQSEEKRRRDWEESLRLVKEQARVENDEKLAKLLREREELLAKLQQAQNNTSVGVPVASITLQTVPYPSYWDPQVSDYQFFDVPQHTQEFQRVVNEFKKGVPNSNVFRIQRNQNKTLWTFYYLQRQLVAAKNGGDPNEQLLFHGSRVDAYDAILREGLDHRVANMGGAIGAGIYFATSSATSAGYIAPATNTRPSRWTLNPFAIGAGPQKKMLFCRVTLGSVGPGQSGLRRPPEKSKGVLYDSVGSPGMYVIFDNHQSFPEYVIHFS